MSKRWRILILIITAAAAVSCEPAIDLMDVIRDTVQAATSPKHILTLSAGTGGTVTPSGAVEVIEGVASNITAAPDSGYVFGSWATLSGQIEVTDAEAAETSLVLTGGDGAVRADFLVELTITGFSPAKDAIDVNRTTPVEVTFNKSIDESSLTAVSFHVNNSSSGNPIAGTLTVTGQTLQYTPSSLTDGYWEADTNYTVTITTGVMDTEGTNLDEAENWSFTTGSGVDNTSPLISSVQINSGETETDNTAVTVVIDASDETSADADLQYAIWGNVIGGGETIWRAFGSGTHAWTLAEDSLDTPALREVYIKVRDQALNVSDTTTASITLYQEADIFADSAGGHNYNLRYVKSGDYYTGSQTGAYDYAGNANFTLDGLFIAETEVDYQLWHIIREWAEDPARGANQYSFPQDGREGADYDVTVGAVPTAAVNNPIEPVSSVSWRDAVAWCNALSEYEALEPVYYFSTANDSYDAGVDTLCRSSSTAAHNSSAASWTDMISADRIVMNPDASGYRLPLKDEWEVAARGGSTAVGAGTYGTPYAGANNEGIDATDTPGDPMTLEVQDVSGYGDDFNDFTYDVKNYLPNELELYDMTGNVYEYTFDWYTIFQRRAARGGEYKDAYDYVNRTVYQDYSVAPDRDDAEARGAGFRFCRNR